jgi:hypothetical protein
MLLLPLLLPVLVVVDVFEGTSMLHASPCCFHAEEGVVMQVLVEHNVHQPRLGSPVETAKQGRRSRITPRAW